MPHAFVMRVVLGVTGGIAAYKSPELVRRLQDAGADVRVILTPNATRFVSPLSLAAVSNHGVIVEQWGDPDKGGVDHVELAHWADVLLIAPATANFVAKLAVGIADDALSTYALAHRGDIIVAPAMNTFMLQHPTVAANLAALRARGVDVIEPDWGLLACGDEGAGRMPDEPVLVERVKQHFVPRDLEGKSVLVTAGPTREPIDPVRYISNRSSGKMGYNLAAAALRRGAEVTLVSGPTALTPPAAATFVPVQTAEEMREAVLHHLLGATIVIKAAAVADYRVRRPSEIKIKGKRDLTLELTPNPDILAEVAAVRSGAFVVGFAAETNDVAANARAKLDAKGIDLLVANDVSRAGIGFDADDNEVLLIDRWGGNRAPPRMTKSAVADAILNEILALRRAAGRPADKASR